MDNNFTPCEFKDITDVDHPWVEKYRLGITSSAWPSYFYVAVLRHGSTLGMENSVLPTENEARILGSYIDYTITRQGFYPYYEKRIRQDKLDIDPGFNTHIFVKRAGHGWGSYRASHQMPIVWPTPDNEKFHFYNLVELLDFLERRGISDEVDEKWKTWKHEHNI